MPLQWLFSLAADRTFQGNGWPRITHTHTHLRAHTHTEKHTEAGRLTKGRSSALFGSVKLSFLLTDSVMCVCRGNTQSHIEQTQACICSRDGNTHDYQHKNSWRRLSLSFSVTPLSCSWTIQMLIFTVLSSVTSTKLSESITIVIILVVNLLKF